SDTPAAWPDMVAELAAGPPPPPYRTTDWPAPAAEPFAVPAAPYAVLHVGASTALKRWNATHWLALADRLADHGIEPVWSATQREASLVEACDPTERYASFAGKLSLPQVWRLLQCSGLIIAPDGNRAPGPRRRHADRRAVWTG